MSKKKNKRNKKNKNKSKKIVSQAAKPEEISATTPATINRSSKEFPTKYTRSKYSMNMFWKAVNLFALLSFLAFFKVAEKFIKHYELHEYFSQVEPYEPGMLDQPISVQGKLKIQGDIQEHEHVTNLFNNSVLFAHIQLSHRYKKGTGQSAITLTLPNVDYVMDLSEHLYISHKKQDLFLKPKEGSYPLRHFDPPLYLGIQDVTHEHDIETVKAVFGEEAKSATEMSITSFPKQRVTVYGKVQQTKEETYQLISTRQQPVIISNISHEELTSEHQKTMLFAALGLLTFFFSKVYIWRGRLLHTYLAKKERYWVFNPASGWEGWGLAFLFLFSICFMGLPEIFNFVEPLYEVQFNLLAYAVLCIALNRLKSMEYFYVADRETQQLILVDTLWGRKQVVPIMNLDELVISRHTFRPRNDIPYHSIKGRGSTLDTPEVKKRFPSGFFDESLSETNTSDWCEEVLDAFYWWNKPDEKTSP